MSRRPRLSSNIAIAVMCSLVACTRAFDSSPRETSESPVSEPATEKLAQRVEQPSNALGQPGKRATEVANEWTPWSPDVEQLERECVFGRLGEHSKHGLPCPLSKYLPTETPSGFAPESMLALPMAPDGKPYRIQQFAKFKMKPPIGQISPGFAFRESSNLNFSDINISGRLSFENGCVLVIEESTGESLLPLFIGGGWRWDEKRRALLFESPTPEMVPQGLSLVTREGESRLFGGKLGYAPLNSKDNVHQTDNFNRAYPECSFDGTFYTGGPQAPQN